MSSEAVRSVPFGELVEFAIGGGWGSEEEGEVPVTIIRGTDFARARFGDLSECPRRFETVKRADRRTARSGDILLEISGGSKGSGQTTGRTLLVTDRIASDDGRTVIPASFCRLIRLDRQLVDPRYAYYHLQEMYLSGRAGRYETQSTGISNFQFKYFLENERVALRPIEEQRRITEVLGLLDEKIESNRRLASTLEEIAAALFQARFVDFVGHEDLVESELGPVPRGWAVGGLSEVAKVTMGQSPPSSTYTSDSTAGPLMVQGKGAFGPRFPKREVFCTEPGRLADAGDLLMTVRAPVGDLNVCAEETCLGRGVAGIGSPHPGFVEFALRAGESRWRAHESGTIYSAVNKKQVEGFPIVIPPDEELERFERAVAPMREQIALCHREMETLGGLRDQLLPRLLSGSLRVGEEQGGAP